MPIASAAISSPRIAASARPNVDVAMLRDDDDRQDRHREDPEEVRDRNRVGESGGAADRRDVQDDDADDLAEAERDDREVVALEPQRRDADEQVRRAPRPARRPAGSESSPPTPPSGSVERAADERGDLPAVIHGQVGRRVAADRHEPGVADRELPGQAVDQIQADGERDVDADQVDDARVVRIDLEVAEAVLEDLVERRAGPPP